MSVVSAAVNGMCAPEFVGLRDVFAGNFARADDGDAGAALAVVIDGELAVDLWGGWRDRAMQQPWKADTLAALMSATKGFVAAAVHILVQAGRIDLDAPLCTYWPAFAACGKEAVLVRHVLDNRAGMAFVHDVPPGAAFDWAAMVAALETAPLLSPPGETGSYHAVTGGFLAGELIRRVAGQRPRDFIAQTICRPWNIDFALGLAPADLARAADCWPGIEIDPAMLAPDAPSAPMARTVAPLGLAVDLSSEKWRTAEIPGATGFATARALAQFYGGLVNPARRGGRTLLDPDTRDAATREQWCAIDPLSGHPLRMGLGFMLNCAPVAPMGRVDARFGHPGSGGVTAFADPVHRLGFAYTPNRRHIGFDGARARRLIDALDACLL